MNIWSHNINLQTLLAVCPVVIFICCVFFVACDTCKGGHTSAHHTPKPLRPTPRCPAHHGLTCQNPTSPHTATPHTQGNTPHSLWYGRLWCVVYGVCGVWCLVCAGCGPMAVPLQCVGLQGVRLWRAGLWCLQLWEVVPWEVGRWGLWRVRRWGLGGVTPYTTQSHPVTPAPTARTITIGFAASHRVAQHRAARQISHCPRHHSSPHHNPLHQSTRHHSPTHHNHTPTTPHTST